ncbi:hypothetical protein [Agilicoccus flavus]|uniref:hypothetical protein n=1 Tax=Agilicoccus flavus TaxID=2775968 RepID=UPI001CF692E4|nr:hypothetical protein [Agilicoccus flavus]
MSSTPTRETTLASPIGSLIRRWPLALGLVLLLGALGALIGSRLPATYTAEARVAVGPGDMSAGAIAGFPQSTRSMAEDYSRWVTQSGFVDVPAGTSVSASPVPESNVIRVLAESGSEQEALGGADAAAEALVASVNTAREETDPQATLAQVKQAAAAWAAAKTELDRATTEFSRVNGNRNSTSAQYNRTAAAVTKAQSNASVLEVELEARSEKYKSQIAATSASADLRTIAKAAVISDTGRSSMQRYGVVGAGLGLLLAFVIAVGLDRRRSSRAR